MDCPRCGAPLRSDDPDCRFCGRGRDVAAAPPANNDRPRAILSGTVEILAVGENKISVIKVLREALKLGLREAKDLAESKLPIKISIDPLGSRKLVDNLREAGANARQLF